MEHGFIKQREPKTQSIHIVRCLWLYSTRFKQCCGAASFDATLSPGEKFKHAFGSGPVTNLIMLLRLCNTGFRQTNSIFFCYCFNHYRITGHSAYMTCMTRPPIGKNNGVKNLAYMYDRFKSSRCLGEIPVLLISYYFSISTSLKGQ
jgi:hypothetical protein